MSDGITILTQPRVYVLGKQVVQSAELERFLHDHGVSWTSDSEVPAEILTETAGRVCYMSFQRPRPGGNSAYLNHIKEVGHGCYDAETEVLTESGWKSWDDVRESDFFATLNPETHRIEYSQPMVLHSYDYDGPMYRVDGASVDLLVTPNHRMYVAKTTTKIGRKSPRFEFTTAEDLDETSCRYIRVGNWQHSDANLDKYADIFKLLGFTIGDGFVPRRGLSLRFRLRRPRKVQYLTGLAERIGLDLRVEGDKYTVSMPEGFADMFRGVYNESREKQIPPHFLPYKSQAVLASLLEGLMNSDGSIARNGVVFYDTTSRTLAGQVQHLCLLLGMSANISQAACYASRKWSYGTKPIHRLCILKRSTMPEVNKHSGSRSRSHWTSYKGKVYCATVPNGTLYVRRNGKPVWCGNSVLEHGVWNLLLTGISRSLTHELVRHRAGWAYSQLSQRYVDESVAEYVEPDIIASDPDLHAIWLDAVQHAHAAYQKLADGLSAKILHETITSRNGDHPWKCTPCFGTGYIVASMPVGSGGSHQLTQTDIPCSKCGKSGIKREARTEMRKAARQAARSVLPNATETKIFVTANARALRHAIEQRCSRHADTEIRKLFGAIWEVMNDDAPNLFGDYRKIDLSDGTFELVTQYEKV